MVSDAQGMPGLTGATRRFAPAPGAARTSAKRRMHRTPAAGRAPPPRFNYDERVMDEFNQRTVPDAFAQAHTPPGRQRPTLSREELLARHELCEDLAQMLCEPARNRQLELGIAESDVLHTISRALPDTGLELSNTESAWVIGRLAELMGWVDENGQPVR